MANSLVLNYFFFHNFVWANSKGSKTVCKCKTVKLRRGKNNPLYSNIAHYITHQTHPDTKADPKRLSQFILCLIGVSFLLIYFYSRSDWGLLWVYSVSAGFGGSILARNMMRNRPIHNHVNSKYTCSDILLFFSLLLISLSAFYVRSSFDFGQPGVCLGSFLGPPMQTRSRLWARTQELEQEFG